MNRYAHIVFYSTLGVLLFSRAAWGEESALLQAGKILDRLVSWGLGLLIAVSVAFVIYAAYLFLMSGGNEEDVKKARKILIYVAVAVAIGLLAKGFVYLILKLVAPEAPVPPFLG